MPDRRTVVEFHLPELPEAEARVWLIVVPGQPVDLCSIDPGHDVDLYVYRRSQGNDVRLDGQE